MALLTSEQIETSMLTLMQRWRDLFEQMDKLDIQRIAARLDDQQTAQLYDVAAGVTLGCVRHLAAESGGNRVFVEYIAAMTLQKLLESKAVAERPAIIKGVSS